MKKAMQLAFGFFALLFGPIALYLVFAWLLAVIPVNTKYKAIEKGIPVYLVSNGVHVDLCLPANHKKINWFNLIDINDFKEPEKNYQYISFGWGDRGFYLDTPTWAQLKASTAFNALFLPSPSAVHITVYEDEPITGGKVKQIMVTEEQYNVLVDFTLKAFDLNKNNKPQRIEAISYYTGNDNFYEANGSYTLFNTCNCWTNQALKRAGIKTASWAPFEWSVLWHR